MKKQFILGMVALSVTSQTFAETGSALKSISRNSIVVTQSDQAGTAQLILF